MPSIKRISMRIVGLATIALAILSSPEVSGVLDKDTSIVVGVVGAVIREIGNVRATKRIEKTRSTF